MAGDDKTGDARTRVLETAWRMIADRRDAAITLVDIAREANVSRQTVYVNFGSRAGLLRAMVEHRDATSPELERLKTARPGATPEQALAGVIRAWFAYIPVVFKVARALSVAGETDADAKAAIESRWQQLRGGFLAIATGLQQGGNLAPGWTPDSAADWCYHLTHIDTWQHLVVERGWSAELAVERTVDALYQTLYVPGASTQQPPGNAAAARSRKR